MGCCVSTAKPSVSSQKHQHSLAPRSDANENRASPPSAEEETVKEVLSETPKPKPAREVDYQPTTKPVFDKVRVDDDEEHDDNKKIEKFLPPVNAATDNEISEVSDVYSLSESVSTTTTKRDEDEEVRPRANRSSPAKVSQRNRAYGGDLGTRREKLVGKSPTRRSEQSPGRRNAGSVRLVQGREPIHGMIARRGLRAIEPLPRRDTGGEVSVRRSRSPATRAGADNGANRSLMSRSPSARRTNRSPGRIRTAPTETETNSRKLEQTNNNGSEGKWPTTNESLENPLVSLECFIFL